MNYAKAARGTLAALLAALLTAALVLLVDPLRPVRSDPAVQAAQQAWTHDLAAYRAAPLDLDHLAVLREALPAYEDRGYPTRPWWLPPLSPTGATRAVLRNLMGVQEGGSTIPQQVAKLYLRDRYPSRWRAKAVELLFATWLVRQAERDEVLGIYLNLAGSEFVAPADDPVGGGDRLARALFGYPLHRLGREEQLLLAASPRGLGWMRSGAAAARVHAARDWLVGRGAWSTESASWLDALSDADYQSMYRFHAGWREAVSGGPPERFDFDLADAIGAFRAEMVERLGDRVTADALDTAMVVMTGPADVAARSGPEAWGMRINYGSIAKLEPLAMAVEVLGAHSVWATVLPTQRCVRWFWTAARPLSDPETRWCPSDVGTPPAEASLDEGVARSVNTALATHLASLPWRLAVEAPREWRRMGTRLTAPEALHWDSPADRAISASVAGWLGMQVLPDEVPASLSYTSSQIIVFRELNARREAAGLPASRLPEDPTQTVGNSSSASLVSIAGYAWQRLVDSEGGCRLSETGALLATRRAEGTLTWLASRRRQLVFSGKTGTSPRDDAIVAVIATCLDGRPAVVAAAARPRQGTFPDGVHGSLLLRGIEAFFADLDAGGRGPRSLDWPADWVDGLPPWATPAEEASLLLTEVPYATH
jgi:hypothetical protein